MEQSKTKKRGTFAAKIIVMVILAVIVSNVICMVFILHLLGMEMNAYLGYLFFLLFGLYLFILTKKTK